MEMKRLLPVILTAVLQSSCVAVVVSSDIPVAVTILMVVLSIICLIIWIANNI